MYQHHVRISASQVTLKLIALTLLTVSVTSIHCCPTGITPQDPSATVAPENLLIRETVFYSPHQPL